MGETKESGNFAVNVTSKERESEVDRLHNHVTFLMIDETETPRRISFRIRKKEVNVTP